MNENTKRILISVLCILILGVGVGAYVYYSFTHTDTSEDSNSAKNKVKNTLGIKSDDFYQFGESQFQLLIEKDENVYVINDFKINENYDQTTKKYTLLVNDKEINVGNKITVVYVIDDLLLIQLDNQFIGLYDRKGNLISNFKYDEDFIITSLSETDKNFKINLTRIKDKKVRINGEELEICGLTDFSVYPELATDIYINGSVINSEFVVEEMINVNKTIEEYLAECR